MARDTILDPLDPRVAEYRHLNDAAYRRQVEAPGAFHHGRIVVEGWLAVERLLPSRYPVRSILVDERRVERLNELLAGTRVPDGAGIFIAEQQVLDAIVGFPLHRGVVAVADRGRPLLSSSVIGRSKRLVVLEGVNDAENLGSICRTAAALGADGLLLDPTTADPLSRRSIRVSVGHALHLPSARLSWPDGLAALQHAGYQVIALTPDDSDSVDLAGLPEPADDDRVALLLGAEGPGLSHAALGAATHRAHIAMASGVDSLNVAAALAIAAHRRFVPTPRH